MLDRPLLWSAVGFAAGLLTQHPALPPARWALLASALLIGALILSICATCMATLRFGSALAFAGLFAAGRVACEGAALAHPESLATLAARHPALLEEGVELSGRLVRSHPVQAADTDAAIDLVVDVERTRLRGDARPSRGRVRIRVAPPLPPAPERGDLVTAFARVRLPRPFRNPGSFDYVRYLRGRGIEALASVKSGRLVTIGHSDDLGARVRLMRRVDRLRAWLLHRLETTFDGTIEGRRGAAVSAALLLGERGRLSAEETLLLQESGLSHLLAVSGFNVAVLAGLLFLPLRAAGLSFRGAAPMVIGVLVLYLLVNQDESSVARAVVMAVAWLAGRCLWRRPDPLNTLGLAGLTLLAQAPDQVHDPGFQLTFVATLGLILFLAAPHRAAGRARVRGPGRERTPRIARAASAALAVTLVATLATMPLGAVHFNRVTPGAVPANLIAGPLMAAAFVGVVAIEAAVVLPDSVARGAARLVSALVGGTFEVAEAVRGVPGLTWRRPTPGACLVATHYAALGCAAVMRRRRRAGLAGPAVWLLAAGSGALLAAPLDTRAAPEGLLVTMLDVGQGEAVLVETPGRARSLVDAGGFARGQFDTGDRVVG
ncbi:MAG TPA: ComEC/Rec2 family competence protein, partial [Candidatus Polarisedimenticolia bacterium]|nr:ComEC/Rec2 family competence protein [Candidatus Polarisedimenticolia bacterium]